MKKIYGNNLLISNLCNMKKSGRTAHTMLFYGEKGTGKKLFADFYASLLIHQNIQSGISGKSGDYPVDTARKIYSGRL